MKTKIKIKTLLNPLIIIFLYLIQLFIWAIFFNRFKHQVYLLGNVKTYFTEISFLRYFFSVLALIFGILLGESFILHNSNILNKKNKIAFNFMNVIFFFLLFLSLTTFIIMIIKGHILNVNLRLGLQEIAYATIHSKNNISKFLRTFINFLPMIIFYMYFRKNKLLSFWVLVPLFFVLFTGIFLASGTILFIVIFGLLIIYVKKNDLLSKTIKIKNIILIVIVYYILLLILQFLRYGFFNSYRLDIPLFSLRNIIDLIKFNITAYFAKDFNNTMIYFGSNPVFNMYSGGSNFILYVINFLFKPQHFTYVVNLGPNGTLNFTGLLWMSWGYFSYCILLIMGFFWGLIYKIFLQFNNIFYILIYALLYPCILSSIRDNLFFQPIFIYNIILIFLLIIFNNLLIIDK